jgi:tRNA modification GTPase
VAALSNDFKDLVTLVNSAETIYALSSGSGRAGIAVVRLTGTGCKEIVQHICGAVPEARRATHVNIADPQDGSVIDRGLALLFPGPNSVTGEDVLEFHVHGGPAIVARLFDVLSRYAKPAQAGAFTRRAFENGKLDLLEVEGLADVIAADSEPQRLLAMRQFLGEASDVYRQWRDHIVQAVAMAEAAIDFNDEAGVEDAALGQIRPSVTRLIDELEGALQQSARASAVRAGVRIVIAGAPNVGKSSLLNAMLNRDAAIVSPIAGTTRDVVEGAVTIAGVPVVLRDTAGLRADTPDEIEAVGIARAQVAISDADVLVWVSAADVDETVAPPRAADLHVFNKIDLAPDKLIQDRNDSKTVHISLKSGEGFDAFRGNLEALVARSYQGLDHAVVVRERHRLAVTDALQSLRNALHDGVVIELRADHLRRAAQSLARVTGDVGVEDYLGQIFSSFCIGK